jgi:hypothetical protein
MSSDQSIPESFPEQTKLPSNQKAIFFHLFVGLDKKMGGCGAATPRL